MFKNLSLTQNIGYGTLLFGATLISIAILDTTDYAFIGLGVALLALIMGISSYFLINRSFDEVDEMAEKHIGRAAFVTLWFMIALWSACTFGRHFIDYKLINPLLLLNCYLGLSLIVFGCTFIYLEKEGA